MGITPVVEVLVLDELVDNVQVELGPVKTPDVDVDVVKLTWDPELDPVLDPPWDVVPDLVVLGTDVVPDTEEEVVEVLVDVVEVLLVTGPQYIWYETSSR